MFRNWHTGNLRRRAPRSCRTCKSWRPVRGAAGPYRLLSCDQNQERMEQSGRNAESTSGSTFHNAPGTLQPGRHPVGAGVLPPIRHGRQPSLLPVGLEAEPAVAVLTCDGNRSSERSAPPLRSATTIQLPHIAIARGRVRRDPAIYLSSLGSGRRDQPHFPPFARRVEKRPITHRQFLRSRMVRQGLCSSFH